MGNNSDEGVVYVSATGTYYSAPSIDADTLFDAIQNSYMQDQLDKTSSKIFNGMYRLTVRDPDGEELEDVSDRLMSISESKGVALWSRMKQAWEDIFCWGPCVIYPKYVRNGNEVVLEELRRLPPESFKNANTATFDRVYCDLLPGITLNDQGELELWQTQSDTDLVPKKLKKGVLLLKDPTGTHLGGDSKAVDLVPIIKMLDFCWDAQMQKINRVGAPIMFIRINNPVSKDDKEYAQTVLQNWGKGKAYQLRPNMEIVGLDVTDNEHALNTIAALERRIAAPFRPASSLDKEGSSIGGNAAAQKESEDDWIAGQRTMIEDLFEGVLQQYLDLNGYEGCSVELEIAVKQSQPGTIELQQAQLGYQSRTLSINEVRERLGASEKSDEEIVKIAEEWKQVAPASTSPTDPQFGDLPLGEVKDRAEVLQTIVGIDGMDPERYMSHDEQLAFLGRKAK